MNIRFWLLALLGVSTISLSSCAAPLQSPSTDTPVIPTRTLTATIPFIDLRGDWSLAISADWGGEHPMKVQGCVPITITDLSSFPSFTSEGPIEFHVEDVLEHLFHEGCHYDMEIHGSISVTGLLARAAVKFSLVRIKLARDPRFFNEILSEDCGGTPGPEGMWNPMALSDQGLIGEVEAWKLKVLFDAMSQTLVTRDNQACEVRAIEGAQVECLALQFRVYRGAFCGPIQTAIPTLNKTLIAAIQDTPSPAEQSSQAGMITYSVLEGDTLETIAERFGTSIEAIMTLNGLASQTDIFPGMILYIPAQ